MWPALVASRPEAVARTVEDPAFTRPTKPVGAFYDEASARRRAQELGWTVSQDGERCWRRTAPSPKPQEIVELETIRNLIDAGTLVIACGGRPDPGDPRGDGQLVGVEAVIDKDRSPGLLAAQLGADLLGAYNVFSLTGISSIDSMLISALLFVVISRVIKSARQ